jgi:hypothetical protein
MPKAHDTWKVLPHRPIEVVAENLWRVEGKLDNMPLKRVMTIARRSDGELVVHNAMALDDASMARIDEWGRVAWIIVPNGYHRLDARVFKERYPAARVLCPRGGRKKVEEVVPVEGAYEDFTVDPDVAFETLDGVGDQEGVMIVRSRDGLTLVFNDAIFNMPHARGFAGWIIRHITQSTGGPRVSRIFKLFVLKDRKAFHAHLLRLADLPALQRLIVSHHLMVQEDAAGAVRQAAATLG